MMVSMTAMIGADQGAPIDKLRKKIPSSYHYSSNRFLDFCQEKGLDILTGYFEWEKEIKKGWVDRAGHRHRYKNAAYNHLRAGAINRLRFALDDPKTAAVMTPAERYAIIEAIKKVKPKKVEVGVSSEKYISYDEYLELVERTAEAEEDPMWALLIEFAFKTTARASEICGILLTDLTLEGGDHYAIRLRTKGGKERDVFVARDLVDRIKEACRGHEYLFEHHRRKYRREHISMKIKRLARRHIGRNISIHGLRHSWAHWQGIERGTPVQLVQRKLGHSSAKTTIDLYMHGEISWEFEKDLYK